MKVVKDNYFYLRVRGVCGYDGLDEFVNVCELEESTIGNLRGQIKYQLVTIFLCTHRADYSEIQPHSY